MNSEEMPTGVESDDALNNASNIVAPITVPETLTESYDLGLMTTFFSRQRIVQVPFPNLEIVFFPR
jgi:hypothetical protein